MIPVLFSESETVFSSQGIGKLTDCISYDADEVLNGLYELSLIYPEDGQHAADILTLFNRIKWDTSGIWFRVQIGKLLILLCTNSAGGQLQFGVTFDSIPYVLTGASQGNYGHNTTNQQIWDLTTSSMRWDARYGESTKYPASLMVIGLYSGQI